MCDVRRRNYRVIGTVVLLRKVTQGVISVYELQRGSGDKEKVKRLDIKLL